MKYLNHLSKALLITLIIFLISCGKETSNNRALMDTQDTIYLAESQVSETINDLEIYNAMMNTSPSQTFFYLSQFYSFTYNFDMPGALERHLVDGWKRPIRFSFDKNKKEIVIWSTGADGIDQTGSGDDISARINITIVSQEK